MFRKVRLGDVLRKAGLIDEKTLTEVLQIQKKEGGKIGEILVSRGMVKEEDMLKVVAEQVGVPFVRLKHYAVDRASPKSFPRISAGKTMWSPFPAPANPLPSP